jgi:hypothetical protein
MFTDIDTDGRRWDFASVRLDPNPPEWLKRDTPVSWSYKCFGSRDADWGGKTKHITDAFIEEISVLRLLNPGEKLAKVLWVGEIAEPPAAATTSDRAVAGEVVIHPPLVRTRRPDRFFTDKEISDRLARAEETGVPGALELEIEHMKKLEQATLTGRLSLVL